MSKGGKSNVSVFLQKTFDMLNDRKNDSDVVSWNGDAIFWSDP